MELTDSYTKVIPEDVRERYELRETRNAAAVLASTNADEFADIVSVVKDFRLSTEDLVKPGGNKTDIARRLDTAFREMGWREASFTTVTNSKLQVQPYKEAGEKKVKVTETELSGQGHKIDNVKGRVVVDVEWNAKDGNLDRDLSNFRALYEAGIIDGAVLITRTLGDLRDLATRLADEAAEAVPVDLDEPASDDDDEAVARPERKKKRLDSTTTTNLDKLEPRLRRGDSGGCPVLAIAISARCYDPEA